MCSAAPRREPSRDQEPTARPGPAAGPDHAAHQPPRRPPGRRPARRLRLPRRLRRRGVGRRRRPPGLRVLGQPDPGQAARLRQLAALHGPGEAGRQDRVPLAPGLHQGDGDQGQLQRGHQGERRLPRQDQPLAPGRPGPRLGPDRDHRRRLDREADPPELPDRARPLQAAQLRQERRPVGQEPQLRPGQQVHRGLAVGPGRAGLQPQADQAGDHQLARTSRTRPSRARSPCSATTPTSRPRS